MQYINSDPAVYSDLNPCDGGQSLYPMYTVYVKMKLVTLHYKRKPVKKASTFSTTRGYLYCVRLSSSHVEFVVSHAEGQDSLVDTQPGRKEHKVRCLKFKG